MPYLLNQASYPFKYNNLHFFILHRLLFINDTSQISKILFLQKVKTFEIQIRCHRHHQNYQHDNQSSYFFWYEIISEVC